MGNGIDVSVLMNGWCPSRIVKLDALREDDLWVHDCSSGNEAMRIFSDSDEARMWKKVLLDGERLQACVGRYRSDFTEPVEALRTRVEQDEELIALATTVVETMAPIVTGIRTTELFRLTQEVDRTIQAMTRAASQPQRPMRRTWWHLRFEHPQDSGQDVFVHGGRAFRSVQRAVVNLGRSLGSRPPQTTC